MIIVMKRGASPEQIQHIVNLVTELGYTPHKIEGVVRTVIAAVGDQDKERLKSFITIDGVDKVVPVMEPYKLASRNTKKEDTIITVGNHKIGGGFFGVIAGPCSVETAEQMDEVSMAIKKTGAQFLRGGAYKPRTSPYAFQGHGQYGLDLLKQEKAKTGMPIVTELLDPANIEAVAEATDIIQIGARNMQNFALLKEVGKLNIPVLLKRGMSATLEELVMSAEYIMSEGNYQVILCERGIRTYEKAYRNTLDLNAVPALKKMTHLPIVVDPSHGTGIRELVAPMTKAAIAAGADGIAIEVHPYPEKAYSDGPQQLRPEEFAVLMNDIRPYVELAGKTFG